VKVAMLEAAGDPAPPKWLPDDSRPRYPAVGAKVSYCMIRKMYSRSLRRRVVKTPLSPLCRFEF
jgi:hypothetical protein